MANPRPQGRMIRVDIADDACLAKLSDGAARLYFYLTPHLTAHGKFAGGAPTMRDNVVPLLGWSVKRILGYLAEINTHTSMKVWKQLGRVFVHDLTFFERNEIRSDRIGRDSIPSYPGADRMKTGTSPKSLPEYLPDLLPHEVEVEVQIEEEGEVEVELEAIRALPSPPSEGGGAAASQSSAMPSNASRDKGNGVEKGEIPSGFLSFVEGLSLMKQDALRHALDLYACGGTEAALKHIKAAGFNGQELDRAGGLLGMGRDL